MSAATTPSQLFLQAAGMSSGWAQNAQGMQFARERAGVADQNAQRDDELRRQQWDFQRQQVLNRIAQEEATKQAGSKIAGLLMQPRPQAGQPTGTDMVGMMPAPTFREQVDDQTLAAAPQGLLNLLVSSNFDQETASREYNRVAQAVNEAAARNMLQLSPDLVNKAQAMGIPVPFDKMPVGMRRQLNDQHYQSKNVLAQDLQLSEGTPEYEEFVGLPYEAATLTHRVRSARNQRNAQVDMAVQAGVFTAEEGNALKQSQMSVEQIKAIANQRADKANRAAQGNAVNTGNVGQMVTAGVPAQVIGAVTRGRGDTRGQQAAALSSNAKALQALRNEIAEYDDAIAELGLAGEMNPDGTPARSVTGDGVFNYQSDNDEQGAQIMQRRKQAVDRYNALGGDAELAKLEQGAFGLRKDIASGTGQPAPGAAPAIDQTADVAQQIEDRMAELYQQPGMTDEQVLAVIQQEFPQLQGEGDPYADNR